MCKDQNLVVERNVSGGSRSDNLRDESGTDSIRLFVERIELICDMAAATFRVVRNARRSA